MVSVASIVGCESIHTNATRLSCFDHLATKFEAPPHHHPKDATSEGEWQVTQDKNPLDDTKRVVLLLMAHSGSGEFGAPVAFIARCQSNETDAYINWGSFLASDGDGIDDQWKFVTTRIGSAKAKTGRWEDSTNQKATFVPDDVVSFLKQMAASNTFVAQVTPYDANPITAVFNTAGMKAALKPLEQACGWK